MLSNFLTSSCSATPTRRVAGSKESFDSFHVRVRSEIPWKHEDCTERRCTSWRCSSENSRVLNWSSIPKTLSISDPSWKWDENDFSDSTDLAFSESEICSNKSVTISQSLTTKDFSNIFSRKLLTRLLKTVREYNWDMSSLSSQTFRDETYYTDRFITLFAKNANLCR
jgi:hypothetical protein